MSRHCSHNAGEGNNDGDVDDMPINAAQKDIP